MISKKLIILFSVLGKVLAITLAGRRRSFTTRATEGDGMKGQSGCNYTWIPVRFKIERKGDLVSGYQYVDGQNWCKMGESTVSLPAKCLVGLVATGGTKTGPITATFDNVSVGPLADSSAHK